MELFKISGSELSRVNSFEDSFSNEKELQSLIEQNLENLFDRQLKLVQTEFRLHNFRFDTLTYDTDTNAFVIIEYKNARSRSVVDQGFAYLSTMLNNKAECILAYNEKYGDSEQQLSKDSVDWSQSRVIFVSPSFNTYQLNINLQSLPFHLYEVKRYENNILSLQQIEGPKGSRTLLPSSPLETEIENVTKEVSVITEEDHLTKGTESTRKWYIDFRDQILDLEDFRIKPTRPYVGFWYANKLLYVLIIQNLRLMFFIHKRGIENLELYDPDKKFSDADSGKSLLMDITDDQTYDYALETLKDHFRKYRKYVR